MHTHICIRVGLAYIVCCKRTIARLGVRRRRVKSGFTQCVELARQSDYERPRRQGTIILSAINSTHASNTPSTVTAIMPEYIEGKSKIW